MIKTEAYANSKLFLSLTKKNGYKAGTLYSMKPTDGAGDFVWGRALSAYRLNASGVLELVASGMPRIDYTNTCPELLIEGARTNKALYSQTLDNAYWNSASGKVTITANATDAPDNTTTADLITEQANAGSHRLASANISVTNGTMYTITAWVKYNGRRYIWLLDGYTNNGAYFDIQNGVVGSTTGSIGYKKITLINGFYKCEVSVTASGTLANCSAYLSSTGANFSYTGDGTSGVYLWGMQFEQGSNATSYIPTTSATVTRPADIGYNSTIAYGLKGTIFIRARIVSSTYSKVDTLFSINDNDVALENFITCSTNASRTIFIETYGNGIDSNSYSYSLSSDGIYSIAIGYDFTGVNNNINIAINGVLKRANSAQVDGPPLVLDRFDLGSLFGTLTQVDNRIIGQMYFADQLSDTDLTALTVQ